MVPIINLPLADTGGLYAHPTPENKRKAVEVLAVVFALFISVMMVMYQAFKAANAKPVNTLRYE